MRWLLAGLFLLIVWFICIALSSRKHKHKQEYSKYLKGLICPHPVMGISTITSRIAISLIKNNDNALEFRYRFIDGYDMEVIDDGNVIDRFVTRYFYPITNDPNDLNLIAEVIEMKTRMMKCAIQR